MDQELEQLASLATSLAAAEILLFSCSAISDSLVRDKGIIKSVDIYV